MTYKSRLACQWNVGRLAALLLFFGGFGLSTAAAQPIAGPAALLHAMSALGQAPSQAANVVGHQKCAECHKSEAAAWLASPHGSQSFKLLSHEKAPDFAKAMGVSGSLASSICGDCHATKTATAMIEGVSCERCHGAAGPEATGWFSIHSNFGKPDIDRKEEEEDHHAKRIASSRDLGMNRSADVYEIATNCLSCHTVPNEKLVNAGHPTTRQFEIVEYSQGSVRHNFQLNQQVNAESPTLWLDPLWNGPGREPAARKKLTYVVGQLVDLEISLRSRAGAGKGDFATAVGRRITTAQRNLNKATHIPQVKQALDALPSGLRRALRNFEPADAQTYGNAADQVGAITKTLTKDNDGSKLGDVDVPSKAVGDPFAPP